MQCRKLSSTTLVLLLEVEAALQTHAVGQHPSGRRVYAYEVDGFGNALHMDDANVPSLLSLPCPLAPATHRYIWKAQIW